MTKPQRGGHPCEDNGHFEQVLEGRTDAVRTLLAKIASDPRHRAVRSLLQDFIEGCPLLRWSMGLVRRVNMAEQMRVAHRDGCVNNVQARQLMRAMMSLAS